LAQRKDEEFAFRWRMRSAGALGSQVGGFRPENTGVPFYSSRKLE